MSKPEKVKVTVGCLAFGRTKFFKDQVLSGAEITPEILNELNSGSGTLEVVKAAPVVKPDGLNSNKGVHAPDNTDNNGGGVKDDKKNIEDIPTLDSEEKAEKSIKDAEEKLGAEKVKPPKKVVPTTYKKNGKETKGKKK